MCWYRQGLITSPFAPLTQQYEQCNYSPKVTFIQVAGITMGNIYLLLPFCAVFFVLLFQGYKSCRGDYQENLYTEYEVKQAMKTLGTSLLLARDKQIPGAVDGANSRSISGNSKNIDSLVLKLAAELEDLTEAFKNHKQATTASSAATPVDASTLHSSLVSQDAMSKAEDGAVVRTSSYNVSKDNTPPSSESGDKSSNTIAVSPVHGL